MKANNISSILISLLVVIIMNSCGSSKKSSAKIMVARMEVKEPIKGVCDNSNVLAILPIPGNGQIEAKAPKTKEEIIQELNSKVTFLKDKPDYKDKGMVNLIINCKGELVRCEMDNKTKSPELDKQIVAVFAEMKDWTPGMVNNNSVDTVVLYSFAIENGKISLT